VNGGVRIGSEMWEEGEEESRVLGMRRASRHNVLAVKRGDKSLTAVSKCMVHRGLEEECGLNCAYEFAANRMG
jgi:hypothetical protein